LLGVNNLIKKELNMHTRILALTILALVCVSANAKSSNDAQTAKGDYIQSVHVVNLLANSVIPDAGMTKTPITIRYYNGNQWPCWSYTVNYQDDYTIHAGPNTGCVAKVDQVVIEPVLVADKLHTYVTPDRVYLDTSKYSSHIVVTQDQAPIFDTQSGLVTTPGTMRIQVQTDSR
jgi:hypothetical protein